MFTVIVFLLIAIVCGIATYREFRKKNFFAVGFAAISLAVFGFFSVMTIFFTDYYWRRYPGS